MSTWLPRRLNGRLVTKVINRWPLGGPMVKIVGPHNRSRLVEYPNRWVFAYLNDFPIRNVFCQTGNPKVTIGVLAW